MGGHQFILITRPQPEAEAYAAELRSAGFESLISPMLEIVPAVLTLPDFTGFDALLLSSPRAAIAFGAMPGSAAIPVYCVGEEAAQAARETGFENARALGGTGAALAEALIDANNNPCRFLHLSGDYLAFDLQAALKKGGHHVTREIVYRSRFTEAFAPQALTHLCRGDVWAVTFFSKRTAENFLRLAAGQDFAKKRSGIKALCISQSVLECVRQAGFLEAYACQSPDRAGMMELITSHHMPE